MEKIFNVFFIALTFMGVSSCADRGSLNDTNEIIHVDPNEIIQLNRSQLFQLEDAFQLILPAEYSYGEVQRLVNCQEDFLVGMGNGNIVHFDNNGNFIRRIGNKGRGQGETLSTFALSCINDTIIILDRTQQKIVQYTLHGEFVKEIPIGLFGQAGFFFHDHYIIYTGNEPGDSGKQITLFDNEFLYTDDAYSREVLYEYMNIFDKVNFFNYNDSLRFLNAFDNTIYNVFVCESGLNLSPRYNVDFGSNNIPESFYENNFNNIMEYSMALSQTNYANRIMGFIETDALILFSFWFKDKIMLAVYSKNNKATVVVENIFDDLVFPGLSFVPVDEWFDYYFINGKIHWVVDPIIFKEKLDEARNTITDANWQSFKDRNKMLMGLYDTLDLHAGPVVIVMDISSHLADVQ